MLYLDMDGVLADLVGGVEDYLGEMIYNHTNYGTYNIQDACDISKEELFDLFATKSFWSEMPKTPWCETVLDWAFSVCDEDEIFILTRPSIDVSLACFAGKCEWLQARLPSFLPKLIFADKKEVFATSNSILVDDNFENCRKFSEAGGKTIFIPTPWGDKNYSINESTPVWETLQCRLVAESILH